MTARLSAAALLLLASLARAGEAPAPLVVRVYHTNDVHGWIMPRPDKIETNRPVGGAAAFKALVDRDRGPKLVLDAGDWWQGTPEGSLTKGDAVAEVFNLIGYDAVELGNHEFDAGQDALRGLIAKMKMPVLAANVYGPDGKRVPWTRPWIVKDVAGVKFGIFGLLTTHMDKLTFPKNIAGLTFRREIDEARDDVKALKKQGAEVIVAVTHVGFEPESGPRFEGDKALAREVAGIDLIVGGHSHTTLRRPWRDPEHGTLVVQTGSYLLNGGRATFTLDPRSHKVLSDDDQLIELRPESGEDPAVKAAVDRRIAEAGKIFETVVATAAVELDRGSSDGESPLGSWMTDCYRDFAGADAALQNFGGIRADMPAGPVTLRTLFGIMPFDNWIVTLKMKGSLLRDVVAHGVSGPRLAQTSGLEVRWRRGPAGRELASVSVGGAPLDEARTYRLATLDFLVSGGEGYGQFGKADAQEASGVLARDVLRACAEKQKTISPPASGRLKALEN